MTEQENEILNAEGLVDSGVSGAAEAASSVDYLFHASAEDFKKIPGSPIAYWVSKKTRSIFENNVALSQVSKPRQGMASSDDKRFVRLWSEVSFQKMGFLIKDRDASLKSAKKWFPYDKGGSYRKWYGNNEFVINWESDGKEVLAYAKSLYGSPTRTIKNISLYFKEGITWTAITSGKLSVRYTPFGHIFSNAGMKLFNDDSNKLKKNLCFLNSINTKYLVASLSQTLNFDQGIIARLPIIDTPLTDATQLIKLSKLDWNTYETSWDFSSNQLIQLRTENPSQTLAEIYQAWWDGNQETIAEMQRLEEENNRLFIDAYGLQDELTPDVPLEEITLTVNPKYRYSGKASDDELAKRFQSDTMAELISYAVGCMFGRYSLDKEGLVLASQGETLDDYLTNIPEPTFMPDDDNVIPMIDFDGDWFEDDISERFKQFLRVSFGEANYAANLAFIEQSLGKDIRKYFLKDFYKDHVQRYKKRPIYWLFSSPKGTFNALIYLHRYRSDTVSVVLNEYLREFRTKLQARKEYFEQINISASSSQKEKTQALKTIDKINKALDEVNSYERDVLYPLAGEQIEIDLDDGVKVNYPKFGTALKKVAGLS